MNIFQTSLNSILPKDRIVHLYVPQIRGREKRKKLPSKEGYLGVEGMETEMLFALLSPFESEEKSEKGEPITKTDLFGTGLSGRDFSAGKRDGFAAALGLPAGLTPGAFLDALNVLLTKEEFYRCCPK